MTTLAGRLAVMGIHPQWVPRFERWCAQAGHRDPASAPVGVLAGWVQDFQRAMNRTAGRHVALSASPDQAGWVAAALAGDQPAKPYRPGGSSDRCAGTFWECRCEGGAP
jgi:hypothetical protein